MKVHIVSELMVVQFAALIEAVSEEAGIAGEILDD